MLTWGALVAHSIIDLDNICVIWALSKGHPHSMAIKTPQLYQLNGDVALLHGSFEQPLSGPGVSRKNCSSADLYFRIHIP